MKSPAEKGCAQLAALSQEMTKALREVFLQKNAYENTKAKKQDAILIWAALQAARGAQLRAEQALSKHIEEHGCKK